MLLTLPLFLLLMQELLQSKLPVLYFELELQQASFFARLKVWHEIRVQQVLKGHLLPKTNDRCTAALLHAQEEDAG